MTGTANEIDLWAQLTPPRICDDAGVPLAVHHLEFVELTAQNLADWRARRSPLGMTPSIFQDFCAGFFAAAGKDGFFLGGTKDLDARLKGSSAVVYSGRHKELYYTLGEMKTEFQSLHKRLPNFGEVRAVRRKMDELRAGQPWPRRRPFDSMYQLGVHPDKSDYDIQLASAEIERRCELLHPHSGLGPLINSKYGFLNDRLVARSIPAIISWANVWTLKLKRTVAVKAFPGDGPPNQTANVKIGELSSHFRTQDWILREFQVEID